MRTALVVVAELATCAGRAEAQFDHRLLASPGSGLGATRRRKGS